MNRLVHLSRGEGGRVGQRVSLPHFPHCGRSNNLYWWIKTPKFKKGAACVAVRLVLSLFKFGSVFFLSLDKKYEAVVLPLFGVATPFHISTIKVGINSLTHCAFACCRQSQTVLVEKQGEDGEMIGFRFSLIFQMLSSLLYAWYPNFLIFWLFCYNRGTVLCSASDTALMLWWDFVQLTSNCVHSCNQWNNTTH